MQADVRMKWFSLNLDTCSMSLCNRDIGGREEVEGAMKNERSLCKMISLDMQV
jgi:hypothetical protein